MLPALLACHEPEVDPLDPPYGLALEHGAIVLRRAGNEHLRLPLDALELGVVEADDDTRSYGPFYRDPLVDWVSATGGSGSDRITLTFEDGSHGTLELSVPGSGWFGLRLVPDAANVAYFRLGLTIDPEE